MSDDPLMPEPRAVRRAFGKAAGTYDAAAVLQTEVGRRLMERLELVKLRPTTVLDVGAGTGAITRALMRLYPKARFTAVDVAPEMLHRARRRAPLLRRLSVSCADARALPFADNRFDLVFSNLMLQWVGDLDLALREFQRVLRAGGVLMFSTFGPDTLRELRDAWAAADSFSHVSRFVDMHDVGDAMHRARLADPVMDMEYFTLTYADVGALMRDLRAIGARNATGGRSRGLTSPARLRAMRTAYERERNADGRLPATWEVVYGHAWGTDVVPQSRDEEGVTRVPVKGIPVRRRGDAP